jgi:phage terminase large subunit
MWNKQKDTGKSLVDLYLENGVVVTKSSNNRVQGHMIMKNMMSPIPLTDPYVKSLFKEGEVPETMPGLMFFSDLERVIQDIVSIQRDDKNPNDCAKDPHDVTHTVDMCRYFCVSRVLEAEGKLEEKESGQEDDEDFIETDYETWMCGGDMTNGYMSFAG